MKFDTAMGIIHWWVKVLTLANSVKYNSYKPRHNKTYFSELEKQEVLEILNRSDLHYLHFSSEIFNMSCLLFCYVD